MSRQPLFVMNYIRHSTTHYNDVIMSVTASQITSLTIVYSTVYSGADQRTHQSSASLAFLRGIHRGPVHNEYMVSGCYSSSSSSSSCLDCLRCEFGQDRTSRKRPRTKTPGNYAIYDKEIHIYLLQIGCLVSTVDFPQITCLNRCNHRHHRVQCRKSEWCKRHQGRMLFCHYTYNIR